MRGGFSKELAAKPARTSCYKITALMELELDFADHEDVEFADRRRTEGACRSNRRGHLSPRPFNSFSVGNAIKNGVPVAIIGETNTQANPPLLNASCETKTRAIVSEIQGTTRDVHRRHDSISEAFSSASSTPQASARRTTRIETIGIERTFLKKIDQADIVLWMVDAERSFRSDRPALRSGLPALKSTVGKQLIVVTQQNAILSAIHRQQELPLPSALEFGSRSSASPPRQRQHIEDLQQRAGGSGPPSFALLLKTM
jgi:tRNA modification GTPase